MKTATRFLATGTLLLGASLQADAAVIFAGVANDATIAAGAENQVLGYNFTVGAEPIKVVSLGYYNPGAAVGTALPSPAAIGIYDTGATGNEAILLGQIPAGRVSNVVVGDYHYFNLTTSITLSANGNYRMAANTGSLGGGTHNPVPTSAAEGADPAITLTDEFYFRETSATLNGGLDFPSGGISGPDGLYLSNLQFEAVPEPSAMLLLSLSGTFLLARARRRQ